MNTWDPTTPITMVAGSFSSLADWFVGGARSLAQATTNAARDSFYDVAGVAYSAATGKPGVDTPPPPTKEGLPGTGGNFQQLAIYGLLLGAVYVFFKYGGKFLKEVI